jgi:hypothetical protein
MKEQRGLLYIPHGRNWIDVFLNNPPSQYFNPGL